MRSFDQVPASVTAAFGDLSRFEEQLRDGFNVGQQTQLSTPYEQLPEVDNNPEWYEPLRDERTGLFLPAALSAQVIINSVALPILERGEGTENNFQWQGVLVRSVQLPTDDIGAFTVEDAFDNSTHIGERIKQNNSETSLQGFLNVHSLCATAKTTRANKTRSKPLSQTGPHDNNFVLVSATHSMHMDATSNVNPVLTALASTSRPTLGPRGAVDIHVQRMLYNEEYQWYLGEGPGRWDARTLHELVPMGRLALITSYTLHTESFGEYAAPYIDAETGYAERVFSRVDAEITA